MRILAVGGGTGTAGRPLVAALSTPDIRSGVLSTTA
jgi:hypothetical protein